MPLNPLLNTLFYYGGPIVGAPGSAIGLQTEQELLGSPALSRGIIGGLPATDERGSPRVVSGKTDVGAFQA